MSAPTTTRPTPSDDVGAPLPHAGLTVAVLGARDSGAVDLAAELRAHTAARICETLGADSASAPVEIDVVLVAVDLICPIRPDDLEAIIALARRFPVAVVLMRAERYRDFGPTASAIAAQLEDQDVAAPLLHLPGDAGTGEHGAAASAGRVPLDAARGEALLRAGRDRARRGGHSTSGVIPGGGLLAPAAERRGPEAHATLDWLQRSRTEAVTARSAVLRQQAHAARLSLQALVSRQIRELSTDAKDTLAAARRRDLEGEVEAIDGASAELSRRVATRARAEATALRRRHLGSAGPLDPGEVPVDVTLRFSRPPIHRGEELVLVLMGSAGGAGLGRLVATPFGGSWVALALIIPLALAAGATLGALGVRARRSAALRNHLIGATAEHFAALRTEIDLDLAEKLVHAEAAITDAFAYDPGPRVRDIEKRIGTLRQSMRGDIRETVGRTQ